MKNLDPNCNQRPSRKEKEAVYSTTGCCSVTKSFLTLCDPMDCSTPGFPVLRYLLEFAQTHVFWVSDAIQPSHPLLPLSPPALDLSQHQGLFQWVGSCIRWPKWWGNPGHFSSLMSERVAWCLVGRAAADFGHGCKLNTGSWRCYAVGHSVHSQQQLHQTQGCREQGWQEEVLRPQSSGLELPVEFLP